MDASIVSLNAERVWKGKNPENADRISSDHQSSDHLKRDGRYSDIPDTPDNRKRVENAIQTLNLFQPQHPDTRFQYRVHDRTGSIQIALVNFRTGETIEEVPSGRLLDFASRLEELSGLVIEKKA